MRVLVLGGGGFLGRNLVEALLVQQIDVRVFERPHDKTRGFMQKGGNLELFKGDFLNISDLEEAIIGCDVIYHLVSSTTPKDSNENPVYDTESNVVASIRMMSVARDYGVKKVVFISSGGTIYGIPQSIPISESHCTDPICSYGISKLAIEKHLALCHGHGGPDFTILRLANPYGKYQSPLASQGAIAVFMQKALNGESVEIWGDGFVVRDYIYIDDVIAALLLALNYSGPVKVFNIGGGEGYSINHILDVIESIVRVKVNRIYTKARKCDVSTNILDVQRAAEVLEWKPTVLLKKGLYKTAEYLRSMTGA